MSRPSRLVPVPTPAGVVLACPGCGAEWSGPWESPSEAAWMAQTLELDPWAVDPRPLRTGLQGCCQRPALLETKRRENARTSVNRGRLMSSGTSSPVFDERIDDLLRPVIIIPYLITVVVIGVIRSLLRPKTWAVVAAVLGAAMILRAARGGSQAALVATGTAGVVAGLITVGIVALTARRFALLCERERARGSEREPDGSDVSEHEGRVIDASSEDRVGAGTRYGEDERNDRRIAEDDEAEGTGRDHRSH